VRIASILALVILTGTAGDILVSRTMKGIGEVKHFSPRALIRVALSVARTPIFWLGIFVLAISFFSFLALLSWAPVSFVVPATALGYAVGTISARFVLHERIDPARWAGVLLLCLGVAVMSLSDIGTQVTPHALVAALRWTIFALACAPLGYYLVSIYAARKFFLAQRAHGPTATDFAPPVSILKPVRGTDRGAYENYASFCRLDYPEYEIVFVVEDDDDAAIPVIRRVMDDYPATNIRLLIGAENLGPSNKVCKLVRLTREARYDLFAISDSDVRVDPDYLRIVVEHFRDPRVGAVTFLFRGIDDGTIASDLDCLGASVEFCGGALVSNELEGTHFAHGATMATTREILAKIGGFEALVDRHSDDFEFGNRISRLGYRVEIARKPVWMIFGPETLGDYLRHELRWAIGLRHIRPGGHAGLLFTQGLPLALLAGVVALSGQVAFSGQVAVSGQLALSTQIASAWHNSSGWLIAAAYLGAYFVLRFLMAWTVAIWGLQDPVVRRKFWLLPVRDLFAFPVWLASFLTDRIQWRGVEFIIRDGRLIPVTSHDSRA
jgi:ceramide glucosyltransferase